MHKTTAILLFAPLVTLGARPVEVDVRPAVRREVGGVHAFNRSAFINVHSAATEGDWRGEEDKLEYYANTLNAFFGRETGMISSTLNNLKEDKDRPGYACPEHLSEMAEAYRRHYETNVAWHAFEPASEIVVAAQLHPFWPDGENATSAHQWMLSTADTETEPLGTATGEFMGRYLKEFFGQNGPPRPKYIEVINEPEWDLVTNGNTDPKDIFRYHTTVAGQIRKYNDNVQVGGFTMAFPLFERDNFNRWHDRFKAFVDIAGADMDFYSIHLYDFPGINRGEVRLRQGSNIEATFDLIDAYSEMTLGHRKPYVISEFGSQLNDWYNQPWTPARDWLILKASNAMLMQFMERPDQIIKAIVFAPPKAEWGWNEKSDVPYYWRLMRREEESKGRYKGAWVWSEIIKFFELWSDVKGTRVLSSSSDVDIQTDAFIHENRLFIILNSLTDEKQKITLDVAAQKGNPLKGVTIKDLFLDGDEPELAVHSQSRIFGPVSLKPEATMVLELTYAKPLRPQARAVEHKYFADTYLQPIKSGEPVHFNIRGAQLSGQGQATLRLGIGRDHGKKFIPKKITINGKALEVPKNFRGDDEQSDRDRFFGLLEIPVPYELIQPGNTVEAVFSGDNGHVSSAALRIINFERSK